MTFIGKDIIRLRDSKLIDTYNRHLNYLRISITDRCNLQCVYCVSRGLKTWLPHKEILRYEEILRLVKIGVGLGISKVRVTGGEPLVRKGVYDFLEELTNINGLDDVSLTTNGVFLKDNIEKIKSAGITRINVSLDTLNREKYVKITGHDYFEQVWEGINLAQQIGFDPIKINVVPLNGINDDELCDFARLSFSHPFQIRFIEYMPIGSSCINNESNLLAPEIKDLISSLGALVPVTSGNNDGPAERYKFEGALGEIGLIRPISRHFCEKCNRLRLTSSGQLRACLLSDKQIDIKHALRKGCLDKELADIFINAVRHKPLAHSLASNQPINVSERMSKIGG